MKPEKKTVITEDQLDGLLQQRFNELLTQLAQDTGTMPIGAVTLVAWPESEHVSVAATVPAVAQSLVRLRIIDMMASKFAKAIGTIKSRINVVRP